MSVIHANGFDTFYQQVGAGPDLLFVHGLAANLAFWYPAITSGLSNDHRVTTYDLRGHGLSQAPPRGYTTRDLALDLVALMDELEIERADLAGHSYGGAVALHAALLAPDRVRSLVLLDCRVHDLQKIPGLDQDEYWEKRREELRDRGIEPPQGTPRVLYSLLEELAPATAGRGNGGPGSLRSLLDPRSRATQRWRKVVAKTTLANDIMTTAGLGRHAIGTINQPVLLMYGASSRCLPTCHALADTLPDTETRIVPERGHFFPLHEPEFVAAEIGAFLSERTEA